MIAVVESQQYDVAYRFFLDGIQLNENEIIQICVAVALSIHINKLETLNCRFYAFDIVLLTNFRVFRNDITISKTILFFRRIL